MHTYRLNICVNCGFAKNITVFLNKKVFRGLFRIQLLADYRIKSFYIKLTFVGDIAQKTKKNIITSDFCVDKCVSRCFESSLKTAVACF